MPDLCVILWMPKFKQVHVYWCSCLIMLNLDVLARSYKCQSTSLGSWPLKCRPWFPFRTPETTILSAKQVDRSRRRICGCSSQIRRIQRITTRTQSTYPNTWPHMMVTGPIKYSEPKLWVLRSRKVSKLNIKYADAMNGSLLKQTLHKKQSWNLSFHWMFNDWILIIVY